MIANFRMFGNGWKAIKVLARNSRRKTWIHKALNEVSKKVKRDIRRNIESGGGYAGQTFKPNSPITLHIKKSFRPWIDSGAHMRNIQIAKSGLNRSIGWDGMMGVTAEITEFGLTLLVTPQMRKWFVAQGTPLSSSTGTITIPGRPNLTALAKKYRSTNELGNLAQKIVGGYFRVT